MEEEHSELKKELDRICDVIADNFLCSSVIIIANVMDTDSVTHLTLSRLGNGYEQIGMLETAKQMIME